MHILRIEHPVPNYEGWRMAFDADPLDRRGSGVRRHRIYRSTDDTSHVGIDLEFASAAEAEAMLVRLRELWGRVQGKVMSDPRTQIIEIIEAIEY
jgi:hypothetical protein